MSKILTQDFKDKINEICQKFKEKEIVLEEFTIELISPLSFMGTTQEAIKNQENCQCPKCTFITSLRKVFTVYLVAVYKDIIETKNKEEQFDKALVHIASTAVILAAGAEEEFNEFLDNCVKIQLPKSTMFEETPPPEQQN